MSDTIEQLRADLARVTTERDRLQRACDEGLPREVIHCPACGKIHIEGPRHDGKGDGRTRPHHNHRCYHCAHDWDDGRWTFGVPEGRENAVTLRLRAEGRAAGLREALDAANAAKQRLLDVYSDAQAAGAGWCVQAIEAMLAKGGVS